jgi:tetratricopeptide (TPR) repeat protein
MVDPVGAAGLVSALPSSGSRGGAAPARSSAFGPDFILQVSPEALAFGQPSASTPIFNEKQAQELNDIAARAVGELNEGRFDSARAEAQGILKKDYNNPIGYHLLGRIAAASGDLDGAIGHYDRAAALAPDNARFSEDAFNTRQLRQGVDRSIEVASSMVKIRDRALSGVRLLFEAGQGSDRQGEAFRLIAEAFETLNLPVQQLGAFDGVVQEGNETDLRAVEQEIKDFITDHDVPVGLAYSLLGRTQQRLGKFSEAIESLETARQIAPETHQYTEELANVYATMGNDALGRGDLSAAEHRFNIAHEMDIANRDITLGLAAVHVTIAERGARIGQVNDARINLGRAKTLLQNDTSLDSEMAVTYRRLAQHAASSDNTSQALTDLENAYARNPDLAGLRSDLADAYNAAAQAIKDANPDNDFSTSEHQDMVDHLTSSFELYPLRSSFRTALGDALNDFGLKLMNENKDYDKALEAFKEARDLDPSNSSYLANWQQAWHLDDQES